MQTITPLMSLFDTTVDAPLKYGRLCAQSTVMSNKDISGVMVCMLPSSMADCEHSPQLCQTKTLVV
jgi:hypothetical protein